MARIIDDSVFGQALEKVLSVIGMDNDSDLVLVNVDLLDQKKAVEVSQIKERPMILFSLSQKSEIEAIVGKGLSGLVHTKGVGFIQLPFELPVLIALYQELKEDRGIDNVAARLKFEVEEKRRLIGILIHDMYPGKGSESIRRSMERAQKELGITGDEDQVRSQLEVMRDTKESVSDLAKGKTVPGVFCDVEGTLVTMAGQLNGKILADLKEYAKTKPITLWTGGELERIQKLVRSLGVHEWLVVSKYDFDGCSVEIAIDDFPQEKFEKDYRIFPKQFVRV